MSVRSTPPPLQYGKPFGAGMGGARMVGKKRNILGAARRRGRTNPRISQSAVRSADDTAQFFERANRIRSEQTEQHKQQQRKPVAPSTPKKVAPIPNLITGEGLKTQAPYKTRMTPKRPWETGWKPEAPTTAGREQPWFKQPVKPAHKKRESPYETGVWKELNKKYPQTIPGTTRYAWQDAIHSPEHPMHYEINEALHKGGVRPRSAKNPSGYDPLYRF